MIGYVARYWWVLALRGVIAVLFGIAAWVWPDLTVRTLVLLFGAYAFVDGIFAIIASAGMGGRRDNRWLPTLIGGIAGVGFGIATWVWPDVTAVALLYLIAFWAITIGVLQVIAAIDLRKQIEGELFLALSGIAAIMFGILVAIFPGGGALVLIWTVGLFSIFFGVMLIAVAWRLRTWRDISPA